MDLKQPGDALYLVGLTFPELGGSEYFRLHGELGSSVPKLDPETNIKAYRRILGAMDSGLIRACHDCSEGGLGVAVAEMAFTGDLGVDLDIGMVPVKEPMRDDYVLFSESNGRLLVEVSGNHVEEFERVMEGSAFSCVGAVKKDRQLSVSKDGVLLFDCTLDELIDAWKTPLEAPR